MKLSPIGWAGIALVVVGGVLWRKHESEQADLSSKPSTPETDPLAFLPTPGMRPTQLAPGQGVTLPQGPPPSDDIYGAAFF